MLRHIEMAVRWTAIEFEGGAELFHPTVPNSTPLLQWVVRRTYGRHRPYPWLVQDEVVIRDYVPGLTTARVDHGQHH